MLCTVPTAVLNAETFKTLGENQITAAVAAAMNYITKRGDERDHFCPALCMLVNCRCSEHLRLVSKM